MAMLSYIIFLLHALLACAAIQYRPQVYEPATPDKSREFAWKERGRLVRGNSCDGDGDHVAITYCYCGAPDLADPSSAWPEAHYIEVNYYNYHLDTTFKMNETCKSTNRMDCLGHHWPLHGSGKHHDQDRWREIPQDQWHKGYRETAWNGNCGLYPAQGHGDHCRGDGPAAFTGTASEKEVTETGCKWDEFCYWPNPGRFDESHKHSEDSRANRVYFNTQQRWLNDQGFEDVVNQDIRDVCTTQCLERTGLPIMPGTAEEVPSHQHCARKVDDMCRTCK